MVENVLDPLDPLEGGGISFKQRPEAFSKLTTTRKKIAQSKSLSKVQETTRQRRGKAKPIPLLIEDPDPIAPPPPPVIISKPPPAPITRPIPPPDPFAIVGNTKFSSKSDFESAKKNIFALW